MDLQFSVEPLEILKWVGLVFAAGFIGYFGRYLSMLILERIHRRKSEQARSIETTHEIAVSESDRAEKDKLKLEKKRLKLEKKRAKKAE
jgi:hypothetical protein